MIPIDRLGISIRNTNCLKAENIYTLDDLLSIESTAIFEIPSLGSKGIVEVYSELRMFCKLNPEISQSIESRIGAWERANLELKQRKIQHKTDIRNKKITEAIKLLEQNGYTVSISD